MGERVQLENGEPHPRGERRAVYQRDPWFYRGVVIVLGAALILSVLAIAMIHMQHPDADTPSGLQAVAVGSFSALAGIFR